MSSERPFAVAVLAGGRSLRMGRDKALLVHEGRTLLERQVMLAWTLAPREVLVVGRPQAELGVLSARGLPDAQPGQGPLGGLATALTATTAEHVLLLAVDMPALTPEFLARVLAQRAPGVGVVPRTAAGWDPLAAVYPLALAQTANACVAAGRLAFRRFVEEAVAGGQLRAYPVAGDETTVLENWNFPGDVGGG